MEDKQTTTVVGTLPANGWYAAYMDGQRLPLIGWAVTDIGLAYGLVVDGDAVIPATAFTGCGDDLAEYVQGR